MSHKINFNFKYSYLYDQFLLRSKSSQIPKKNIKGVQNLLKVFKSKYYNEVTEIAQLISRLTGLKWFEKNIDIYFTTAGKSFSDPLTINILRKDSEQIKNLLIHELIHRIFIQKYNLNILKKYWIFLKNKYPDVSQKTRNHIPLNAFLTDIYFLKSDNLSKMKESDKKLGADYLQAWQIVERKGYKKIIQEFTKKRATK